MRLEDITAEVRPRVAWEAIDLGFHMAQAWWRALALIGLVLILPFILLLHLLLYDHLIIASLLTWWFKPLYDRVYLYFYSRTLFGETPTVRDTLHALPTALLNTGLFMALTVYRFDPARAFTLPVWQLEGLRGAQRRTRIRLLQRPVRGTAIGLTFACLNFELVLDLGLLLLIVLFIPQHLDFGLSDLLRLQQDSAWAQMLASAFYLIALSIIEPCYIAAGFALYLNRRTLLEGWDIELAFRRLAERLRGLAGTRHIVVTLLLTGLLTGIGLLGLPSPAVAATASTSSGTTSVLAASTTAPRTPDLVAAKPGRVISAPDKTQARTLIKAVLARKAFGDWKQIRTWHYLGGKPDTTRSTPGYLVWLIRQLAAFGEFLLWGLVATLIVLFIVYRARWLALFRSAPQHRRRTCPDMLLGMDIRPESLPDNIPDEAQCLWERGARDAALSLLYRAALAILVDRDRLELAPGATEGDCLHRVEHHPGGPLATYFARLTQAWQHTAYAHRPPAMDEMHLLLTDWTRHFDPSHDAHGQGEATT